MTRSGIAPRWSRLSAVALALVLAVPAPVGIAAHAAATAAPEVTSPDAFGDADELVTRDGTELLLAGEPFRFTGVNIYNANSDGWCGAELGSGAGLDRALTEIGDGHEVVRAWFFQTLATDKGTRQRDWSAFDHTLETLASHGMRAIVTLTDQWGECGTDTPGNGFKTADWYTSGYLDPQPGLPVSYRDWVAEVVTRYAGDPRIAFWQLINEAEVRPTESTPCPVGDLTPFETLHDWAADVSGLIKSIDPDHLVSLGTIGSGQCGTDGSLYQDLHAIPTIDLCEFHDYGSPAVGIPGDQWNGLQVRIDQCAALDKPIFVGEAGIRPDELDGTLQARADAFAAKIDAQFAAGVQGFLAWAWSPQTTPISTTDNYDMGPGDPAFDALEGPSLAIATPTWSEPVSIRLNGSVTGDGSTSLVTVSADRGGRAISAGGARVAFTTEDQYMRLPAGTTNGYPQVYVRDRDTAETFVITTDFGLGASISADGRFVAYEGGLPGRNVYIAEVDTGQRWLASRTVSGTPATGTSNGALISANGRRVVFHSDASNLVVGDTNGAHDVFVYDLATDAVELVSVATGGAKGNGMSFTSVISDDGSLVAFRSSATNLVANDTNGVDDIFVRDLDAGTTTRVSVRTDGGQADGRSFAAAISRGHLVAFSSEASNLVDGTEEGLNLYIHDLVSGATTFVDGPGVNLPVLSSDERFLSYYRWPGLAVRDLQQGGFRTVPNGDRGFGVDPDGRFIATATGSVATLTDLDAPPDLTPPTVTGLAISPNPVASGDQPRLTGRAVDVGRGIGGGETFFDVDPGEGSGDPATIVGFNPGAIQTFLPPTAPGDHDVFVRAIDNAGLWSASSAIPMTVSPPGGRETAVSPASHWVTTDADFSGPTPEDPLETYMVMRVAGDLEIDERPLTVTAPAGVTLIGQEVHLLGVPQEDEPATFYVTLDASLFPAGQGVLDLIVYHDGIVVPPCDDVENDPTAEPDPCVPYRLTVSGGDARVHVWTMDPTGIVTFGLPPVAATVPDAPGAVVAAPGDGEAAVSWLASVSDGGSPITGYIVTASTGPVVPVGAGVSSAIVTGLANDTSTTFTVAAVNDVGTGPSSPPSDPVTPTAGSQGAATTIPPGSGGEASTAGAGGATAVDPFTTTVTVPPTAGGGVITVVETADGSPPPGGLYEVLGQSVEIVSTASTSDVDPLTIVFVLDESLIRGAFSLGPTDPLPDPTAVDITRAEGGGTPTVVPGCLSLGGGGAAIDPSPTCIAERVYDAASDLRITVLSAAASTWGAVVSPAPVAVNDKRFQPASVAIGLGDVVVWSFDGSKPHTVTESAGLGPSRAPLFSSGPRTTGRYGRTFDASGTFSYRSAIKADPSSMTGTVAVPVEATPVRGGPATTFAVRWATGPLAGYASDVQVRFRKAGSSKWSGWSTWKAASTAGSATFVPDRGLGDYAFRARLINTATGKASAWSPEVSIRVE